MQHPETTITAPDDSPRFGREAVALPGQPQVEWPGPCAAAEGDAALANSRTLRAGKAYRASLVRQGLRILSLDFGIAALWFVIAWIQNGWMPLGLAPPPFASSFGAPPAPVLPSEGLLAVLGFLLLLSLGMMLLGSHNPMPKQKQSC